MSVHHQHAKDTEIVEDRRVLGLIPEATHRYHALQQNIHHTLCDRAGSNYVIVIDYAKMI